MVSTSCLDENQKRALNSHHLQANPGPDARSSSLSLADQVARLVILTGADGDRQRLGAPGRMRQGTVTAVKQERPSGTPMGPGRGRKPSNPWVRPAEGRPGCGDRKVEGPEGADQDRSHRAHPGLAGRSVRDGHDAVACRCSGAAASDPRTALVDRPAAEGHGRDRIQGDALGGRGRKRGSRADHVSDSGTGAPHQPSQARSPTTPYIGSAPVARRNAGGHVRRVGDCVCGKV
jgi:hypothetical protein